MHEKSTLEKVFQHVFAYANSAVLLTLMKTGIFDSLHKGDKTINELAEENNVKADVLARILRYGEFLDLVEKRNGAYTLKDVGRMFVRGVPWSMAGGAYLLGSESFYRTMFHLDYSLKTGKPAFDHVHGVPLFEYMTQVEPELGKIFNSWMTEMTKRMAPAIVESYNFSPYATVCDIGGGEGHLLKVVLLQNPHLKGILYDLEPIVQNHVLKEPEFEGRYEIRPGNFFESVPEADVLILKKIIHDWDDEKSEIILKNCRKVMDDRSRLLIIDQVVNDTSGFDALFFDIHMLVMNGGKERTKEEFEHLFEKAGLRLIRIYKAPMEINIIEAGVL